MGKVEVVGFIDKVTMATVIAVVALICTTAAYILTDMTADKYQALIMAIFNFVTGVISAVYIYRKTKGKLIEVNDYD